MTNHKKLIDVTASLERNCLYLEKKRYTKNRSVCTVTGLVWELHAPTERHLLYINSESLLNLSDLLLLSCCNTSCQTRTFSLAPRVARDKIALYYGTYTADKIRCQVEPGRFTRFFFVYCLKKVMLKKLVS